MRILITKAGKIVLEDLEDLQESCPKTMNIIILIYFKIEKK